MTKKKHHYVAVTYLKSFCDQEGFLRAFDKDRPDSPIRIRPDNIGFRNHYYSHESADGVRDNESFEALFCEIESHWPKIINEWTAGRSANDLHDAIIAFLAMHRVRVPAIRDSAELSLAEVVRATAMQLDGMGKLPPKPAEIPDNFLETMVVTIDPRKSLEVMGYIAKGFARIVDQVGFEIVVNDTNRTFITSDNPVAVFDPNLSESTVKPYVIDPFDQNVEILFPVSRKMLLRGHKMLRQRFLERGYTHRSVRNLAEVERYNRYLARFGYQYVYAADLSHSSLIKKHALFSPVSETRRVHFETQILVNPRFTFGRRPTKPKWQ